MNIQKLAVIFVFGVSAFGSGTVSAQQMVARFQTRAPRECPAVTSKPSPAQAVLLIQCRHETMSEGEVHLLDRLSIQFGGAQPYNERTHAALTAVDTTSSIYPVRGSYTSYNCIRTKDGGVGTNCVTSAQSNATGYCWVTTFGNWDCIISQPSSNIVQNQPPPAN